MNQSCDELHAPVESAPQRKSGRAVFDHGRTVWEWQTATGVFERHVSEEQLSRLEASNLRLVDQASEETGSAIYGSKRLVRREAAVARAVRSTRPAPVSALRQLLRRLVTSI